MRTCLASTVEYSGRSEATPTYKVYYPLDTSMLLRGGVAPEVWQNVGKLPMRAEVASLARAVTALWRPNLLGGLVTPKVWFPQASPTQGGQGG